MHTDATSSVWEERPSHVPSTLLVMLCCTFPVRWQVGKSQGQRSKASLKLKVTHAIYLYLSSQISPEYLGSTPPKSSPAGMLVTCLNCLNWLLLMWWKSGSTLSSSWMTTLFALSLREKPATRAVRDSSFLGICHYTKLFSQVEIKNQTSEKRVSCRNSQNVRYCLKMGTRKKMLFCPR